MNRRDILLKEMNITQWVLRKPQVLKGDAQIRLSTAVKLVVICEEDQQQSRLFQDILHSLSLSLEQYQWYNAEQALRLNIEHSPLLWCIQNQAEADKLAKKFAHLTAVQSESWQALSQAPQKRQLWQQLSSLKTE